MLLVFGIVAIVVFTIQVYKTADGTGRNAALWAMLTAGLGIGLQFILPMFAGIVVGIWYILTGGDPETIEDGLQFPMILIGLVGLVGSVVAMFLVWRFVGKVRDEPSMPQPPPPPSFG